MECPAGLAVAGCREIIRATTDAGLVGYGVKLYPIILGDECRMSPERVKEKSPIFLVMMRSVLVSQMALYDVVGKALDVPVYRLFNLPKVRSGN